MARELLHVSAIVDASIVHKLLMLFKGKAVAGSVDIRAVEHGGEREDDGKVSLVGKPTGREFVLSYMRKYKRFDLQAIGKAGLAVGLTKGNINQTVKVLMGAGALKRVGKGEYAVAGKRAVEKAAVVRANGAEATA